MFGHLKTIKVWVVRKDRLLLMVSTESRGTGKFI